MGPLPCCLKVRWTARMWMWTVEPHGLWRVSASCGIEIRITAQALVSPNLNWKRGDVSYCSESVLVPERTDDVGHQPALLKPAHGQLWTQCEEVTHLVQVQGTLT